MVCLCSAATLVAAVPVQAQDETFATLNAALTGQGGAGAFSGDFDGESGDICYSLTLSDKGEDAVASIQSGTAGEKGKLVVELELGDDDAPRCVSAKAKPVMAMIATPDSYFILVTDKSHPSGAVSGPLVAEE